MIHNARVASQFRAPGIEALPALWVWLEGKFEVWLTHLLFLRFLYILGSKAASDVESSRVYGFDFAYQGVLSIWEGLSPSRSSTVFDERPGEGPRGSSSSGRGSRRLSRTKSSLDPARLQYETAIETVTSRKSVSSGGIVGVKKEMPKAMVSSLRPTRRQYALALCDWDLTDAEFEEQIQL